jgi:hypothetical protein
VHSRMYERTRTKNEPLNFFALPDKTYSVDRRTFQLQVFRRLKEKNVRRSCAIPIFTFSTLSLQRLLYAINVTNFARRIFLLGARNFYSVLVAKAPCFHSVSLVSSVRIAWASGEGKPRIPSGIEGWAGFLPRPLSAFSLLSPPKYRGGSVFDYTTQFPSRKFPFRKIYSFNSQNLWA